MIRTLVATSLVLLTVVIGAVSIYTGWFHENKDLIYAGILLDGILLWLWGLVTADRASDSTADGEAQRSGMLGFSLRYWGPAIVLFGMALFVFSPECVTQLQQRAQDWAAARKARATAVAKVETPAPITNEVLRLGGIFTGNAQPGAMINGKYYRLGDQVGMAVIIGINPDSVLLEENGQQQILRMRERVKNLAASNLPGNPGETPPNAPGDSR